MKIIIGTTQYDIPEITSSAIFDLNIKNSLPCVYPIASDKLNIGEMQVDLMYSPQFGIPFLKNNKSGCVLSVVKVDNSDVNNVSYFGMLMLLGSESNELPFYFELNTPSEQDIIDAGLEDFKGDILDTTDGFLRKIQDAYNGIGISEVIETGMTLTQCQIFLQLIRMPLYYVNINNTDYDKTSFNKLIILNNKINFINKGSGVSIFNLKDSISFRLVNRIPIFLYEDNE